MCLSDGDELSNLCSGPEEITRHEQQQQFLRGILKKGRGIEDTIDEILGYTATPENSGNSAMGENEGRRYIMNKFFQGSSPDAWTIADSGFGSLGRPTPGAGLPRTAFSTSEQQAAQSDLRAVQDGQGTWVSESNDDSEPSGWLPPSPQPGPGFDSRVD